MMKRSPVVFSLLAFWFLIVLLACNLTDSPEPPTLVPRASATPPPTIGYATLAPNQYPLQATQSTPITGPSTNLLNEINEVDADRLFETIDTLVSMQSRRVNSTPASATGIDAAATYVLQQFNAIRDQSFQSSFAVSIQDFPINWDNTQSTGKNIIGISPGTDVGGGVIVLGAHYDSINYNFTDPNALAPGADDNATGIAALLEIARIMSQHRHRATILFVAFSAEEIQRMGSKAFVADYLQANHVNVTAMLDMDIIGSSTGPDGSVDDNEIRLYSADPNESSSRQLARELNLFGKRLYPDMSILVQNSVDRQNRYSDHMSFSDAGFPSVRFVEADEEINREHSERDTKDDIQVTYLVRSTQAMLACMTALADGLPPPQNIDLRQDSDGRRTLNWQPVQGAVGYIVALREQDGLAYHDYFPTNDTSVTWDGFVASRYGSLAISSVDANNLMGPVSIEFAIGS